MIVDQAAVQDRIERRQIGILKDAAMEFPVVGGEFEFVIDLRGIDHLREQRLQIANKSARGMRQRPHDAAAFDLLANLEHLDRFGLGALRHLRAAMTFAAGPALLPATEASASRTVPWLHPKCAASSSSVRRRACRQKAQHDLPLQRIERRRRLRRLSRRCASGAAFRKIGHCGSALLIRLT